MKQNEIGSLSLNISTVISEDKSVKTDSMKIDTDLEYYIVSLKGPESQIIEAEANSTGVIDFNDLDVGTWVITVTAYNEQDKSIGTNVTTVEILPQQNVNCEIIIYSIPEDEDEDIIPEDPVYNKASQITQFGITWTFDKEYDVGQFANGDWWVKGPVTITSITKPHALNGKDGSMINPIGGKNGYNDLLGYDLSLDVSRSFPFTLGTDQSLVSTISWVAGDANCPALISNPAPAKPRPLVRRAAVLTCLCSIPPAGTFRPAYSGTVKKLYNIAQLQWSILPSLDPVSDMYTLKEMEDWFNGPWIDHGTSYAFDEYLHPGENWNVGNGWVYGREIAWKTGDASLMLMVNTFTQAQKEKLMINLVQFGIDTYWAAMNGAIWSNNGGHASGRKWPILFAGLMLDDADMKSVGTKPHTLTSWRFGEDEQTFYVDENTVKTGIDYTEEDIGMPEWGIRHYDQPELDWNIWNYDYVGYRTCCTATAWVSELLAVRLMNAISLWNNNALFDYQDRYMGIETNYRAWTEFSEQMWDKYR